MSENKSMKCAWVKGMVNTEAGQAPQITTILRFSDWMGTFWVRLGVGRMHYMVKPGLYAIGSPTADSPVLVSANYKLSFDCLRRELTGLNVWLVVLDTKGVNVWCAAGKGTFSTKEIVKRLKETHLEKIVSHRTLIVPQLAAVGVAAHEVKKQSGFRVVYGPVRAADIPAFLSAGMKAVPEMRKVHFDLPDRAVLIPLELISWGKWLLLLALGMCLFSGLGMGGYAFSRTLKQCPRIFLLLLTAFLSGNVLTPLLLPWLPGRAFSVKGAFAGTVVIGLAFMSGWIYIYTSMNFLEVLAWIFIIPAVSAFLALNFTGSSTYTSLSGVQHEMRIAMPIEIITAAIGMGLWIASHFF